MDYKNYKARELSCFNAYDIRGELGNNFDEDCCYRVGVAFSYVMKAKIVVVGHDARLSSPQLARSLIRGLNDGGVKVLNLGLCGTEEVYFGTSYHRADGGIVVTGSHNPINYNGLKMVKFDSKPLDQMKEFLEIKRVAESLDCNFSKDSKLNLEDVSEVTRAAYCTKILSFVDFSVFRPLKIIINCGNGAVGPTLDAVIKQLTIKTNAIKFKKFFHKPDGNFPNGIPNPLIPENQTVTSRMVLDECADLGVAFDGDFDRCFFFDEKGRFISGEHIIGLLATVFLDKEKGASIVHDPRVVWNITDIVKKLNGKCVQSKTGHAFIKKSMFDNNAIYGGEMSAHHYFRDFFYCDSGMIPWLIVCFIMSQTGKSLSSLIDKQVNAFPSSGEHNFTVSNPNKTIEKILNYYKKSKPMVDRTDGVSIIIDKWRMNLRVSNTEPLLRLNIESIGNSNLVQEKLDEVKCIIGNM